MMSRKFKGPCGRINLRKTEKRKHQVSIDWCDEEKEKLGITASFNGDNLQDSGKINLYECKKIELFADKESF